MQKSGKIILLKFPPTDLSPNPKLRPALVIGEIPSHFNDWLVCMISSQLQHCVKNFDEIIKSSDPDFTKSGLRKDSLIRIGRLAVIDNSIICGSIGEISLERLNKIRKNIADWLVEQSL